MMAVVILGALVSATALVVHDSSRTAQAQTASSDTGPTLASYFSAFRRAATAADQIPAAYQLEMQTIDANLAPDFADTRAAAASNGEEAYIVPVAGGACVINANENFCADVQHLPGANAVDICSPNLPLGQIEIEWVVPDGSANVRLAASDGTVTRFAPGFDVYITKVNTNGPLPVTIQWDDANGQHHSVRTAVPADAATQTCATPATGSSGGSGSSSGPAVNALVGP